MWLWRSSGPHILTFPIIKNWLNKRSMVISTGLTFSPQIVCKSFLNTGKSITIHYYHSYITAFCSLHWRWLLGWIGKLSHWLPHFPLWKVFPFLAMNQIDDIAIAYMHKCIHWNSSRRGCLTVTTRLMLIFSIQNVQHKILIKR